MNHVMTRRTALQTAAGATLAATSALSKTAGTAGRLKQSACKWCYSKISLDDLAKAGADFGLSGIDLINHDEWPTVQKYGLVPAMTPGAGTIPDGWNRKESHDRLEKEMRRKYRPRCRRQSAQRDHLFRQPQGHGRRYRQRELHHRPQAREKNGRRHRRHDLHGTAEQQDRSPRLHVRSHSLGR